MQTLRVVVVSFLIVGGCGQKDDKQAPAKDPPKTKASKANTVPKSVKPPARAPVPFVSELAGHYQLASTGLGDKDVTPAVEHVIVVPSGDKLFASRSRDGKADALPGNPVKPDALFAWVKKATVPLTKQQAAKARHLSSRESSRSQHLDDRWFVGETFDRALGPTASAPLVFVDRQQPAGRIVGLAAKLCQHGLHLAVVTKSKDQVVVGHRVGLGTFESDRCKTSGGSGVGGHGSITGGVAIELSANAMNIVIKGKKHSLGDYKDAAATAKAVEKLLARRGRYRFYLSPDKRVDVQTFIRALDALALARVRHVHLGHTFAKAKKAAHARDNPMKLGINRLGTPKKRGSLNEAIYALKRKLKPGEGGLDRSTINKLIMSRMKDIRDCYARHLELGKTINGRVHAHFKFNKDGRVTESSAKGVNPQISECIARTLATIKFPKSKAGATVNFPFNFTTSNP